MYRLMIVDDERHIVDWLFELFMDKSGLDLDIVKAFSGKEAMQLLETSKIDVVLSDIRMPGMSGLELMEKVCDNWPGCKIIFLTGYNEFDYLYSAVKQSGVNYLLKTEDDEEIIGAVEQAIVAIEQERSYRQLQSSVLERDELVAYLMRKELLLDVLNGKARLADAERDWLEKLAVPFDGEQPVIVLFGRIHGAFAGQDYAKRSRGLLLLSALAGQYFAKVARHALVDIDRHDTVWFMQPATGDAERASPQENDQLWRKTKLYIREMLETLQVACEQSLQMNISFLMYDQPVHWQTVGEKCDLLKSLAGVRIHSPGSLPVICSIDAEDAAVIQAANKTAIDGGLYARKAELLQDCLEQGLPEQFFAVLNEIDEGLQAVPRKHDLPAAQVYCAISLLFLTYINRNHLVDKLADRIGLNRLLPVNGFDSWRESFAYLRELGQAIFDLQEDERAHRKDELIERIKAFVRSNLHGELTLVRISEKVNYNPSYVSRFFKQTTGANLFDFINKTRLAKAKELLEDGSRPIQEIARATGFDSPQYFATAFKKMTGMTPHEYRNQLS